MKLNASRTKAIIVSRYASPIGRTVLKESDDLDILGVTFDSKMTVEHLHSFSKAASQRLGILNSWQVFND